jgi:hypothetical protein
LFGAMVFKNCHFAACLIKIITMNKIVFTLTLLSSCAFACGQTTCIRHWSKNPIQNQQLDSIMAKITIANMDYSYCDTNNITEPFDYKWYINFYNKQVGKYFSNAESVNSGIFYCREKSDSLFDEIRIIQFALPGHDADLFKSKYGESLKGYSYFNLKVFTLYKYIVKQNSVYFISTESYQPGRKTASFLDRFFKEFVNY